jgi:2-methylfumaryl-CoA isomerase
MYRPLAGLRVVECASFVAGPSCGLHLAQLGADVIRLDNVGGGPDFHRWPRSPTGGSLYWEGLNKNKKSVAVDLRTEEGRELALAIACASGDNAGLFVTNFPPEGFLSYERMRARRADLICVRVMGWPDGGTGVDYTINAAVGVPDMTGPPEWPAPVNHVLPAWDLLTGAYAAFALVAAERDRRLSGVGREIRLPLSDVAAASVSHLGQVAEVLVGGADRPRYGNELYGAFGRDFSLRDGRVMIVAITPRQWKGLVEAVGLGSAMQGLEAELGVSFETDEDARFRHRDQLIPLLEDALAERDLARVGPLFDRLGVCWAPYQSLRTAVMTDARLFTANSMFSELDHSSGHRYPAAGAPGWSNGETRLPPAPAPRLGENTDEVLSEVLGLSSAEIDKLHSAGVLAGRES